MSMAPTTYPGYRFPAEVIDHAIRLHHLFSLSLRDIELILAERGVVVSHESIRRWCHQGGFVYPMEGPGLGTDLLPAVFERPDLTHRVSEA